MSDGHGSTPSTPPGWAENQPPPYSGQGQTPWTAPGGSAPPVPPAQPGPGRPPYGPPGHGQAPDGRAAPVPPGHDPDARAPQYGQVPYDQGRSSYGAHGQAPVYGQPYGYRPPPQALRPGIIPLRPLGLGDILDGTIKLIRSNPKATLGLSAIAAAIGTLPLAIGQAVYYRSVGGLLTNPAALESGAADVPIGGLVAQLGGAALSMIMQFFLVTMLTGVLTRILGRSVFGGKITIGEAWRLTRSRLPALFGLALLTGLIALAPLAVGIALVLALAAAGASVTAIVLVGMVLVVAYIAYALFISTRFALAAPAVVLERRGVVESMRRSWTLVSGDFWRVLGILILTGLLAGVLGSVLSVPFSVISLIVSAVGQGSVAATVITAILFTVGGILSSMITYPIQAGVNGLLYTDRRMRAEAFDLVLQTAAIEQQRQGWVSATADDLWHPSHAAGASGPHAPGPGGPYGPGPGGPYGPGPGAPYGPGPGGPYGPGPGAPYGAGPGGPYAPGSTGPQATGAPGAP
ncbi:glycerophosphoryl diester phosphodiesterase membrane domain-containing protein [Sphaerisporangium sp. NPDC049002]|uniref:glycerophosphoryl diester phosphodiesterase membrane domain-containing protein n=1 Tax=Sphaerisporangium sp. NPDC049002 TaxID=3155392 RepID=UPI0033CAC27D